MILSRSRLVLIAVFLLALLLVIGWFQRGRESKERRSQATQVAEQAAKSLLSRCSEVRAIIDWQHRLSQGAKPWDKPLFTVQMEDVFRSPGDRPYLFFARINDIKRVKHESMLLATASEEILAGGRPADSVSKEMPGGDTTYFHLRLTCPPEYTDTIPKDTVDGAVFALFVTVRSVEKPDLFLYAKTQRDEDEEFSYLVLTGQEMSWTENRRMFVITGECRGIIRIANTPWWQGSDYPRFRECFDRIQKSP
jgi:hypothetical protein